VRFEVFLLGIGLLGCGRLGFEPLGDGDASPKPQTDALSQTCALGSMCRCLAGETCNFSCPSGTCSATCEAGSTCTFDCRNATSCIIDCARTASCSISCPSLDVCARTPCESTGGCNVRCTATTCVRS
jgi:hypothetical protein